MKFIMAVIMAVIVEVMLTMHTMYFNHRFKLQFLQKLCQYIKRTGISLYSVCNIQ